VGSSDGEEAVTALALRQTLVCPTPGRVDRFRGRYYGARVLAILPLVQVPDIAFVGMSEGRPPDPLRRLGEDIEKARAQRVRTEPATGDRAAMQGGLAVGLRIGIELVVAVVVATGLGWAIDRWLGTRPWGMIVLFFLGVAAGMLNVYRAVTGVSGAAGYRKPPESGAGSKRWDDEDC
jgi:ATP synthase protein I